MLFKVIMKNMKFILLNLSLILLLFSGFKCTTGSELKDSIVGQDTYTSDTEQSGTLTFFIDASTVDGSSLFGRSDSNGNKEDILSLVVTVDNLEVHRTGDSDAGWIELAISGESFDLIELDTVAWADLISSTSIKAGDYNKIRIEVSEADVTTDTGTYVAEIPSGKIKINIPFKVNDDGTTEITISIDPEKSLIITGSKKNPKYILTPVLKVSSVVEE